MRTRRCATMRRPASSIMALIAPVRLRSVASGLMIEKVRSIAITQAPWKSPRNADTARRAYSRRRMARQDRKTDRKAETSELLDPRPQLDLPAPRAPRLAQQVHVALRDGGGVEHAVGLVGGLDPPLRADAAVDHHMGDVDALRRH